MLEFMWVACATGLLVVILLLWGVSMYNSLVRLRNLAEEGWSGVDVQLKRRHDLADTLVNSVRGYMTHERAVLEEVTRCRAAALKAVGVSDAAVAENMLSAALGRLSAVMESYPTLRASEPVMHLQTELSQLENDLSMARRYYNGATRNLNIRIQEFPSCLIARRFGFTAGEFFKMADESEKETPSVSF